LVKWQVIGADAQTGEDRVFLIEAAAAGDAEAAVRRAGYLVSQVTPTAQTVAAPRVSDHVDPLAELAAATAPAPALPPPTALPYRSPVGTRRSDVTAVPEYWGLRFGSTAFLVLAGLCYLAGLLGLLLGFGMLVQSLSYQSGLGVLGSFAQFLLSLWPLAVGTVFHAASSACMALRDVARNSFSR
jgi:hypothetical protein